MDEDRFDRLARTLTDSSTRRALLRLATALPLAGWSTRRGEAQAKRPGTRDCDVCPKGKTCAFHSIREAVAAASPGDTIRLCAGTYREDAAGEPQMLILTKDLTLIGAGAGKTILDGQGVVDRTVIEVGPGATVALEGLSITGGHGRARANAGNPSGQGGGITNAGDLTLTDCLITGNRAADGGGIFTTGVLRLVTSRVQKNRSTEGGGIFTYRDLNLPEGTGTVTLVDSAVTNNTADTDGGGIRLEGGSLSLEGRSRVAGNRANGTGGGIYTIEGEVTLTDSSAVSKNRADLAGGIFFTNATVTLRHASCVDRNEARSDGGGIVAREVQLTLEDTSNVTRNKAGGDGGGIYIWGSGVTLQDTSRVAGNKARGNGGGIFIRSQESVLVLEDSSQVTGNAAGVGGGGIFNSGEATVTLAGDAQVTDNQPDNCAGDPMPGCSG